MGPACASAFTYRSNNKDGFTIFLFIYLLVIWGGAQFCLGRHHSSAGCAAPGVASQPLPAAEVPGTSQGGPKTDLRQVHTHPKIISFIWKRRCRCHFPAWSLIQKCSFPHPVPRAYIGHLFDAITALSDCAAHNDGEREEAGLKKLEVNKWFPAKGQGCCWKERHGRRAQQEQPGQTGAFTVALGCSAPAGS